MAEPISNIVKINTILQPEGLGYANFTSMRAIAALEMLSDDGSLEVDTYRDYASISDVSRDFSSTSAVYQMAQYWFGSTPTPDAGSFQVYMRDDADLSVVDTLDKAADRATWKFAVGLPVELYQGDQSTCLAIAAWADANQNLVPLVFSDAASLDQSSTADIPYVLLNNGARFITQKFRSESLAAGDARQSYAWVAEMAYFQRFSFDGVNTAVDPEFAALPNVASEDLRASQYIPLQERKLGYYTLLDLKGEVVRSRVRGSWTTSAYGETVDDVFLTEVMVNRMQVDGFNYISQQRRGLRSPKDYAGLLDTIESVARQANINGTLATDAVIMDPRTGDNVTLKYGYLMVSDANDVQGITEAQIAAREYPPIQIIVVLARGARAVSVNLYVQ